MIFITLAIFLNINSTEVLAQERESSLSSEFGGLVLETASGRDMAFVSDGRDSDEELDRVMNMPSEHVVANEQSNEAIRTANQKDPLSLNSSSEWEAKFNDNFQSDLHSNSRWLQHEDEKKQLRHRQVFQDVGQYFGGQPESSEHQFISVLNNQSNVILSDSGFSGNTIKSVIGLNGNKQTPEVISNKSRDAVESDEKLASPSKLKVQLPVSKMSSGSGVEPNVKLNHNSTVASVTTEQTGVKERKKKRKKGGGTKPVVHRYKTVPKVLIRAGGSAINRTGSMISYTLHPATRFYYPPSLPQNEPLANNQMRSIKGVPLVGEGDLGARGQLNQPASVVLPKTMSSAEDFTNFVYAHNTRGPFDSNQANGGLPSPIYNQKYVQKPQQQQVSSLSSLDVTATSASNEVATSLAPNVRDEDSSDENEADPEEDVVDKDSNEFNQLDGENRSTASPQLEPITTAKPKVLTRTSMQDAQLEGEGVNNSSNKIVTRQTTATSGSPTNGREVDEKGTSPSVDKESAAQLTAKEATRSQSQLDKEQQVHRPQPQAVGVKARLKAEQLPPRSRDEQELLVGPFKSESEAPDTITLAGIVYQKSGSSSSLVEGPKLLKPEPKYRPSYQTQTTNDQIVEAFNQDNLSVGSSTTSASLYGNGNSVQQQQPAPQLLVTSGLSGKVAAGIPEKYWPYLSMYQPPRIQQKKQQVRIYQPGNQANEQLLSTGNILLGSIASKNTDDPVSTEGSTSIDDSSGGHQITLVSPSNTLRLTASSYPIRETLSSLLTDSSSSSSSSSSRPTTTKTQSNGLYDDLTGSGTILTYGNSLASLLDSSSSSSYESSPGGGSLVSSLRAPESGGDLSHQLLKGSGSEQQHYSTSSSSGGDNPKTPTRSLPITSESYMSETKHKEKVAPIVIVQKDVKPVKYHLLRAYLKLRRLMRPFEATYVFPNENHGGIIRRDNRHLTTSSRGSGGNHPPVTRHPKLDSSHLYLREGLRSKLMSRGFSRRLQVAEQRSYLCNESNYNGSGLAHKLSVFKTNCPTPQTKIANANTSAVERPR